MFADCIAIGNRDCVQNALAVCKSASSLMSVMRMRGCVESFVVFVVKGEEASSLQHSQRSGSLSRSPAAETEDDEAGRTSETS